MPETKSLEKQLHEKTVRAEEFESLAWRFRDLAVDLEKKVDYYKAKAALEQAAAQEHCSVAKQLKTSHEFWYDTAQGAFQSIRREQTHARDLEDLLNATCAEFHERRDELMREIEDLYAENDKQHTEIMDLRKKLDAQLKVSAAQQFSKGVHEVGCSMALSSCKAVSGSVDTAAANPSSSFAAERTGYTEADADDITTGQIESFPSSLQLEWVLT